MTCPSCDELSAFVAAALGAGERARIEAHVDVCSGCWAVVTDAARGGSDTVTRGGADAAPPTRPEPGGDRYRILDVLGVGGMGAVYTAEDRLLGRRVALKLLHLAASDQEAALQAQALVEARLLARLSHPHVTAVYDAGRLRSGVVFLAMELVDGETLRRWQERGPGRDAILAAYHQAALGLCAAHAAGVVHGDFKPDNVLIDREGRVRVTDFGLARAAEAEGAPQGGTPAYLAPEIEAGAPGDARSDQFSFCVALHEALFGAHPYGADPGARARALRRGPPPRPAAAPRRLWDLLRRGLHRDPAARHRDLRSLAAMLAEERGRGPALARRRRRAMAALALLAALLPGGGRAPGPPPAPPPVRAVLGLATLRYAARPLSAEERSRIERLWAGLLEVGELRQRAGAAAAAARAARLAGEMAGTPQEADALSALGAAQLSAGDPRGAAASLARARPAALGAGRADLAAQCLVELARITAWDLGEPLQGRRLALSALAENQAIGAEINVAEAQDILAVLDAAEGRIGQARRRQEEALRLRRRLLGESHPSVARSLLQLGHLDLREGAWQQAEARYLQALALRRAQPQASPARLAAVLVSLGQLRIRQRRLEEAAAWLREAQHLFPGGPGAEPPAGLREALGALALARGAGEERVPQPHHAYARAESR